VWREAAACIAPAATRIKKKSPHFSLAKAVPMSQSEDGAPAKQAQGSASRVCFDAAQRITSHTPFPGFFASFRRKSTAAVAVASAETKQASASVLSSFKSKDWKGDAGRIKVRRCMIVSDSLVIDGQDKLLLQTIGGEAALIPETREDVISTGIVANFHALSDFVTQLHAAVKAIGDAESKSAREHERLAALCTPFNLDLPFAASISTLGKLHTARADECRGVYQQFKNLSIEEKARRISADVRTQAADSSTVDPADGEPPATPAPGNELSTPYGKLVAALSAFISGPLFSIGRYVISHFRAFERLMPAAAGTG
jgi:hypothetical protein